MDWINWSIAGFMGLGALLVRRTMKTWFAPASFFFLYWSVFTIIPMICAPRYTVYWRGLSFIFGTSIIMFVGSLTADKILSLRIKSQISLDKENVKCSFPYLPQLILICTVVGFISFGYMCYDLLQSIEPPISVEKLDALFKKIRWSSQYSPPIVSRFLNSFIYFGGLLGGINFVVSRKWYVKSLSFCPFIVALLYTIVLTTKSAILYPAVLFSSTSIALLFYNDKYKASLFYFKYFILTAFVAILCIAFIADKIRGATSGDIYALWEYLKPSFFGHISNFTLWFHYNWHYDFTPAFGSFTFSGVFDALSIKERISGIYHGELMLGKHGSNIYTIFRGLIQDFTLFGSFIISFIIGFLSQLFFRMTIDRKRIAIAFLSGFYAFVLWGFVVSIFNYNSIILSFAFLFVYLFLIDYEIKSRLTHLF